MVGRYFVIARHQEDRVESARPSRGLIPLPPIPDHPQKPSALLRSFRAFDALRHGPVDHAQHPAAQFAFRHHYLHRVGRRAEIEHTSGTSLIRPSTLIGYPSVKLMPPMVIADLGAGEGTISQLMAQRAKKVIAIDDSEKMVEFGVELARKHGIANLEYRLGDLEDVPIRGGTVDLAFLSQALHHAVHPERAIAEAWRILQRGGRIAILAYRIG